MLSRAIVVSLALLAPVFANFGAIVAHNNEKRGFYIGGGWGLVVSQQNGCPAGTNSHQDLDIWVCCPNGFEPQDSSGYESRVCCEKGVDCASALQSAPFCASTDWNLYGLGDDTYFCCLPGQQGTLGYECVSNNLNVAASSLATSLGAPAPTGAAASTTPVSLQAPTTAATGAGTTTFSKTVTTSTTKSSGGGLLSSIASVVTSHSDAGSVKMESIRFFGSGLTMLIGTGLGLLAGFAVVLAGL